jgi:hypothetical protein
MKCATLLLLGTLMFAAHAAEPTSLKLSQTIPLPGVQGRFDHFAVDMTGRRLFVAALGNNTLEVIDLVAGKRIQSVAGMSKPTGILYFPESNRIFVANGDDGTLKILDGATYKAVNNLTALDDADNLRYDLKTKLAYLGYGDGALGIIDTASAKAVAKVQLPKHPESFQLEKDGRRIFVNVPDAKQVAVIDRDQRTVVETWPMEKFQANFPMALDEGNHRLFIGWQRIPAAHRGRASLSDRAARPASCGIAQSVKPPLPSSRPAAGKSQTGKPRRPASFAPSPSPRSPPPPSARTATGEG